MLPLPQPWLSRREASQLTAAGVLSTSVSGWFNVLASRAASASEQGVKHKSCILLWMAGGPAQSHTFDVKPGGDFKPIATSRSRHPDQRASAGQSPNR